MTTPAALLRIFGPWLAAPALAGAVWIWRDMRAAEDLRQAERVCALERRATTAEADAHAERSRHEISRDMEGVRPDADLGRLRERLRDGEF